MSSRSVFPIELIRLILSDVAASFTEDQYELVRDKGSPYTREVHDVTDMSRAKGNCDRANRYIKFHEFRFL